MQIERHISNLKQYIEDDEIIEKDGSDFANFCQGHIDDIQAVLNYIEMIHSEFDRLEGIEDNTVMLKHELEKKDKRLNRQFKQLQKKDKEIEELKKDNSLQWEERCRLTFEIEKKDKVIDEMAWQLLKEVFCSENGKKDCCKTDDCEECIKEYFYKKVE